MKQCKSCGREKDKKEFHGHSAKCKPCQTDYCKSIDVGTSRLCKRCLMEKPIEEFRKNNRCRGGRAHWCSRCEMVRRFEVHYGIENIYEFIKDKSCGICANPIFEGYGGFAIDHDHNCCKGVKTCGKCIRGILCGGCNKGLGGFRDNIISLQNAIIYLRRFNNGRYEL